MLDAKKHKPRSRSSGGLSLHRRVLLVTLLLLATLVPSLPFGPASAGSGTPTFALYAAPGSLNSADGAGEPSVGVNWNTGAVMYQAFASTYKVVFNDATVPATAAWSDVTSPTSITNIDPILFTESSKGRTFAGGLNGACSSLSYTDNDGQSWTQMGNACAGAGVDHESIGAGPWKGAAPLLSSYDRGVYYCAQTSAITCATSTDGGLTFGAGVAVSGACGGLHGSIHVGGNGNVYVPTNQCGGKVGGAKSTNNGGAFSSYTIPGSVQADRGFDPDVATTPDNTLWQSWSQGGSYHSYVARSTDAGATWTRMTDLSTTITPNPIHTTFHETIAGDNGRVAVAFLGSTGGSGNPFNTGYSGVWHLYVSYTYDAGLTWATYKATTDPVQKGCIWDQGGSNACRNLLDFMDATVTKDGRVLVGFADGCIATCATGSGASTASYATIARQSTGKGLFAAYDGGATAPAAPTLSATSGNARVDLSWTTPANNGATITGYKLYRGGALHQTLGVVNAYADTAVTNGQTYTYTVSAVNSIGEGALSNQVTGSPAAGNIAPTACFSHSETNLATSVNGGCSTDSDGTISSYAWNWGDSTSGSGATATHTYAAGGTYTVTLTVTDNAGATGTTSQSVTVASAGDPDPGAFTLTNGVAKSDTSGASGTWKYYKIQVPSGKTSLSIVLDGPACGLLQCNPDLDLFTKRGARPSGTANDCSPEEGDSDETCTHANPAADWWYVGVKVYSGNAGAAYTVRATYS